MRRSTFRRHWPLALACSAGLAALVTAGPLDPPAGPITSTYKTLTEVEPRTVINPTNTPGDANSLYRITVPGSYYLDRNLLGVSGKHGIEIAADNVTIDLNGFTVTGASGALDGINSPAGTGRSGLVVRNGTIRNWPGTGLFSGDTSDSRLSDLHVLFNSLDQIWVGENALIERCQVAAGRKGILCRNRSTVRNCTAGFLSEVGIEVGAESTIIGCTVTSGGAVTGFGVVTGSFSVVESCTVNLSAQGFRLGGATLARHCIAAQSTGGGHGFTALGDQVRFESCESVSNSGRGFSAPGTGHQILNCLARGNTNDGINVGTSCQVIGNHCDLNGNGGFGAGIRATGGTNVIDGNTCLAADDGIVLVTGSSNVVTRNVSRNNSSTNYSFPPGNDVGPLGFVGSATSPWANIQ